VRLAPFVPIAIAFLGVAAILLGGVVARQTTTTVGRAAEIDPVTTGSVAKSPADQRRILEMLDL
jgi:hypothetical protein